MSIVDENLKFVIAKEAFPASDILLSGQNAAAEQKAVNVVLNGIIKLCKVRLPVIQPGQDSLHNNVILIGLAGEGGMIDEILKEGIIHKELKQLGSEGFLIHRVSVKDKDWLVITALRPIGLLYASYAFCDRLFISDKEILCDINSLEMKPSFAIRSFLTSLGGPDYLAPGQWEETFGRDYRAFIDYVVSRRVNNLILMEYGRDLGIGYRSRKWPHLVNPYKVDVKYDFMNDLIDYAHENNISIFFGFGLPDHNNWLCHACPELAAYGIEHCEMTPEELDEGLYRGFEVRSGNDWRAINKSGSELCLAKSENRKFWAEYVDEVVKLHPRVDGVVLQLWERYGDAPSVCTCPQCRERQLEFHLDYFRIMREQAMKVNPKIKTLVFLTYGSIEVTRRRKEFPELIEIDWDNVKCPELTTGHRVTSHPDDTKEPGESRAGDWFLMHTLTWPLHEAGIQYTCRFLKDKGFSGYLNRLSFFEEGDSMHQAFAEFTWNPDMSLDEFSDLYVTRKLRRKEPSLAKAYAKTLAARYLLLAERQVGDSKGSKWLMEKKEERLKAVREAYSFCEKCEDFPFVRELRKILGFLEQGKDLPEMTWEQDLHKKI